jgi:hypothetical protein
MGYRDYSKEVGFCRTGIHTLLNSEYRVSSAYRTFANPHFETWAWETFLWKGDRIEKEYPTLENADRVIDLHTIISKEVLL